jgi:hypothetical protein
MGARKETSMATEKKETDSADTQTSADGEFSVTFTAEINMAQYAKRFGLDIPDDTIDAELTDDRSSSQASDAAPNGPVPAEDADVTYAGNAPAGAANCQATLSQCQAKNPLTCRFHGAKAIAQDIEAQIRAQNVPGKVSVEILGVNSNGILSVQVNVKGPASDKKAILAGLKSFAQLPGVERTDIFQRGGGGYEEMFDIDTLDPQAQARWGQGQQPPTSPQPPSSPTPAPAKSPTPPAQPQTQNPPTQQPSPGTSTTPPPPQPPATPAPKKQKTKSDSGPKHPVAPPTDGSPSEEQKRKDEIAAGE